MAGKRTAQAALTIALTLFVMLTFALGVTTYLFFTKRQEAETAQQSALSDATAAQAQLEGIKQEMETLRGIIGVAAETPVAEIETGLSDLFAGDFAGFQGDQKSYLKLIEWLRGEFRDKSDRVKTVEQEKRDLESASANQVKAAQDAQEAAETAAASAKQELEKKTAAFTTARSEHETRQNELLTERRAEEDKARELQDLRGLIAGLGDYLPPGRQEDFRAAGRNGAGENGKGGGDHAKQLDIIGNELRSLQNAIRRLNDVLTEARIADPAVQAAIADLGRQDERIEGFDGRVVDVDPRSGTVLVSSRSTNGVRPGLVLNVFGGIDERPQIGDRKAMVEVVDVEGPTLLRATIRRENTRDPIVAGDGVASSLWSAGLPPEVVIVGFTDIDADGRSDRERLAELVTRTGGRVGDTVSAATTLLVDLGRPAQAGDDVPGLVAEEKRRDAAFRAVKLYGTRVGGLDTLLDMLGLDPASFGSGRLPRAGDAGRLPARR